MSIAGEAYSCDVIRPEGDHGEWHSSAPAESPEQAERRCEAEYGPDTGYDCQACVANPKANAIGCWCINRVIGSREPTGLEGWFHGEQVGAPLDIAMTCWAKHEARLREIGRVSLCRHHAVCDAPNGRYRFLGNCDN